MNALFVGIENKVIGYIFVEINHVQQFFAIHAHQMMENGLELHVIQCH